MPDSTVANPKGVNQDDAGYGFRCSHLKNIWTAALTPETELSFFSSRRRHTILQGDWSSDVCSSDLTFGSSRSTPRSAFGKLWVSKPSSRWLMMLFLCS